MKIKFTDEVRLNKERDSSGNIWISVFGRDRKHHRNENLYKNETLSKMYSPQKNRDAEIYYIVLKRAQNAYENKHGG